MRIKAVGRKTCWKYPSKDCEYPENPKCGTIRTKIIGNLIQDLRNAEIVNYS
ncbi:MAG: conserved hypothetical protein [Methanobrevibacter sp. CfCl-M3]